MSHRSVLHVLFWAVVFGGVMAILTGEQRSVSLRLWLAGVVLWFGAASVRRLFEGVPLVPAPFKALFVPRWRKPVVVDSRLRKLRALEVLLVRSRDNNRAFSQQLHPRMVELADHFLPMTHGIDRHTQPDRVKELLGDVGWMLDPIVQHRSPTLEEIDELVYRLTHSAGTLTEEAA